MKFTIEGFNQEYAMTLAKQVEQRGKLVEKRIDCIDLVILRWLVDFYPRMDTMDIGGVRYVRVSFRKVKEDLPLLDLSKRAFSDRLQKLVEFDILKYKFIKDGGTFSLFAFGENYPNLVRSNNNGVCVQTAEGVRSNNNGYAFEQQRGVRLNNNGVCVQTTTKDKSIIDTSIINKSIIDTSIEDTQRACAREESNEEETLPEFENPLYKQIAKLYNGTCTSLPKVTTISSARERVIKTRLKEFTVKQFQTLFRKAQASKFLTGKNKNNWRANFDWLMNATNFAKVLDGNYDDYVAPHDGMSGKPEDDLPF